MGKLVVQGSLEVTQFWPLGSADADTVKIEVKLEGSQAIRFTPNGAGNSRVTRAFDAARVIGKSSTAAIKVRKNGERFITVRLQGVDAPELHYRPSADLKPSERTTAEHDAYLELNEEYRQPWAESGAAALGKFLWDKIKNGSLECRVETNVDSPDEVFDTYGRFVGNVLVKNGTRYVDVNLWLAEHGWAFPTFYNSMTPEEIGILTNATNSAYEKGLGIWGTLPEAVGRLDWKLRYRPPSSMKGEKFVLGDDAGAAIYPKLFRRLATWEVNRRAKMAQGTFAKYLAAKPDRVYRTADFLENGHSADIFSLGDFIAPGTLAVDYFPEELVFVEAKSKLIDPRGRRITTW